MSIGTNTTRFVWVPWARVGSLMFASLLLISAWLKAAAPEPAAHSLAWTGLSLGERVLAVDAWNFLEAAIAGALLCAGRLRWVQGGGCVVALTLLGMHALGMTKGADNCGCFGDVVVPDGVTLGLLVVGAASCGALFSAFELRPRGSIAKWIASLSVAAVIAIPTASRSAPEGRVEDLLVEAAGRPVDREILFIVGSKGCSHCEEELRHIAAARETSADMAALRYVFVTRSTDENRSGEEARYRWLESAVVSDDLWWRLILEEPPTFLRVRPGATSTLAKTWR